MVVLNDLPCDTRDPRLGFFRAQANGWMTSYLWGTVVSKTASPHCSFPGQECQFRKCSHAFCQKNNQTPQYCTTSSVGYFALNQNKIYRPTRRENFPKSWIFAVEAPMTSSKLNPWRRSSVNRFRAGEDRHGSVKVLNLQKSGLKLSQAKN